VSDINRQRAKYFEFDAFLRATLHFHGIVIGLGEWLIDRNRIIGYRYCGRALA